MTDTAPTTTTTIDDVFPILAVVIEKAYEWAVARNNHQAVRKVIETAKVVAETDVIGSDTFRRKVAFHLWEFCITERMQNAPEEELADLALNALAVQQLSQDETLEAEVVVRAVCTLMSNVINDSDDAITFAQKVVDEYWRYVKETGGGRG